MSKRRTARTRVPSADTALPPAHRDRRHYPRRPGIGLVANIAGQLVRVVEFSATGLTLERRFPVSHQPMAFTLYPVDGTRVDLNGGMRADGVVVHEDGERVGLRFQPARLALVQFVAAHMP